MKTSEQRVDFVGCHHIEENNGLVTYSDMANTQQLLNEKLEVLDSKGFEVVSVVPVISGRGVLVETPQVLERDLFSRLIHFLGSSRKQRKQAKENSTQGSRQSMQTIGYSYTQGFTIFSKRKCHA